MTCRFLKVYDSWSHTNTLLADKNCGRSDKQVRLWLVTARRYRDIQQCTLLVIFWHTKTGGPLEKSQHVPTSQRTPRSCSYRAETHWIDSLISCCCSTDIPWRYIRIYNTICLSVTFNDAVTGSHFTVSTDRMWWRMRQVGYLEHVGGQESCVQNFGGKIRGKGSTWKTYG